MRCAQAVYCEMIAVLLKTCRLFRRLKWPYRGNRRPACNMGRQIGITELEELLLNVGRNRASL